MGIESLQLDEQVANRLGIPRYVMFDQPPPAAFAHLHAALVRYRDAGAARPDAAVTQMTDAEIWQVLVAETRRVVGDPNVIVRPDTLVRDVLSPD